MFSSSAAFASRVALVIGNSAYQNVSRLTNPVNDADSVGALLKRAGFTTVKVHHDLGNLDFKRAIRDFVSDAKDADVAVIFFAGHGIEVNGTNYMVPVDAKFRSDFDVPDEGVALDRMIQAIEPAKRLRLIIIDACRDNPFDRNMQRRHSARAVTGGLARIEPTQPDTLVAYAAKAGLTAQDGEELNSPFTSALLQHLTTPGSDIRMALGRVRDEVLKRTRGKQEPFVYGTLGGETMALVPEIQHAPIGRTNEILRDYEFAERIGTLQAWEFFLTAHKSGFYVDLARAQVAKLNRQGPSGSFSLAAAPKDTERGTLDTSCKRDEERLHALRISRAAQDAIQFSRELTCEALRPQVLRLIESTSSTAALQQPSLGTPQSE